MFDPTTFSGSSRVIVRNAISPRENALSSGVVGAWGRLVDPLFRLCNELMARLSPDLFTVWKTTRFASGAVVDFGGF